MVEILLAMGVTGMIAAAVASMLVSVSYGTANQADQRKVTVKEKVVTLRISEAIRNSKMVLAAGTDYLVLWMGDRRRNGVPDLSEIRRIDRDSSTQELSSYKAPLGIADADNASYVFTDDFDTITDGLMGATHFPGELWATHATVWNPTLDQTNPQTAKLVSFILTLTGNNTTGTTTHTISLRSR